MKTCRQQDLFYSTGRHDNRLLLYISRVRISQEQPPMTHVHHCDHGSFTPWPTLSPFPSMSECLKSFLLKHFTFNAHDLQGVQHQEGRSMTFQSCGIDSRSKELSYHTATSLRACARHVSLCSRQTIPRVFNFTTMGRKLVGPMLQPLLLSSKLSELQLSGSSPAFCLGLLSDLRVVHLGNSMCCRLELQPHFVMARARVQSGPR